MTFKNFDIDYDEVTIDENVISRPAYLSSGQWLDFWEVFNQVKIYGSFESALKGAEQTGYEDGEKNSEKEHEREIDDLMRLFSKNITKANSQIETQAKLAGINNPDFLRLVDAILYEAIPE